MGRNRYRVERGPAPDWILHGFESRAGAHATWCGSCKPVYFMPRISFDYPALDTWYEATGEGASKWDICTKCFQVDSRQLISTLRGPYNGEPFPLPSEHL